MQNNSETYFENLDGLRFLSFLSVFFFHSFSTEYAHIRNSEVYILVKTFLFGNGNLGVNFFFVLSGFLITYLLIKEKELFGKIDIVRFWKRRMLRIWPLFYSCVLFGFIAFPFLKSLFGQVPNETARPLFYLFFLNNFDFIVRGLPDASVLGVLWSVAIEEQFYFVWPIFLLLLPTRLYPYLFGLIVVISILFRGFYDSALYNEYHTLSCMSDMAIGALGACAIHFSNLKYRIENLNKGIIIGLYAILALSFLFRKDLLFANLTLRVIERPLLGILFLAIILEQNYSRNSLFKLGNSKVMSYLGKITYGLYCLHFIGILVVTTLTKEFHINDKLWEVMILETGVALMVTIGLAMISYRYFESPFLRWKEKFEMISVIEHRVG